MFIGMFPFNLPSLFVFVAAAWRIKDGTLTRQLPAQELSPEENTVKPYVDVICLHINDTLHWTHINAWFMHVRALLPLCQANLQVFQISSVVFKMFQNDDLWGGSTQQDQEDSLAEERSESFEIRSTSSPKCRAKKRSPKLAPCPSACCWPRMVCHVGRHLAFDPAVNHSASLLISDPQTQHQNLQKHAAHWGEAVT